MFLKLFLSCFYSDSPTKNKGKVFFVAKSSGPLLGRLPLKQAPNELDQAFPKLSRRVKCYWTILHRAFFTLPSFSSVSLCYDLPWTTPFFVWHSSSSFLFDLRINYQGLSRPWKRTIIKNSMISSGFQDVYKPFKRCRPTYDKSPLKVPAFKLRSVLIWMLKTQYIVF